MQPNNKNFKAVTEGIHNVLQPYYWQQKRHTTTIKIKTTTECNKKLKISKLISIFAIRKKLHVW